MRVASIDMTNPSQQCPPGLETWNHPSNPSFNRRLCDRTSRDINTDPDDQPSCNSTIFPINGVRYSRIVERSKPISFTQLMHSVGTPSVVVHKPLLMSHMLMESV